MENKQQAFQGIEYTLGLAKHALEDLVANDPSKRLVGLSNLAAWGRSVTNALQRLRGAVADFDDWYQPKVDKMKSDDLCSFFYRMRTETLKQAQPPALTTSTHIGYLDTTMINQLNANAPAGTIGTFIGDGLGGSGWEVQKADGSTEKVYARLPEDWSITSSLQFPEPPKKHLGAVLADGDVMQCGRLYYAYLDGLVQEAKVRGSSDFSVGWS